MGAGRPSPALPKLACLDQGERERQPPGEEKKRKTKLTPNRKFLLLGALFTDAAAETSPFPRSHQLEEDTPHLSPV